MAIQNRRGSYTSFGDGTALEDGEFGIVMSGDPNTTDGTAVYIDTGGNTIHRVLMDDDKTELADDIAQNASDIDSLNDVLTNSASNYIADCDNATASHKWYSADGNTANRPNDTGYWTVVPIRYSGTHLLQLAFLVNSQIPVIYARNKNASGFGAWFSVGASASPTPAVSYGKVTSARPAIAASGGIAILHFSQQIPAGTYTASDVLWTVTPTPRYSEHFIARVGSNTIPFLLTDTGAIRFNNSHTAEAAEYIIGQCVYRY